MAVFESIKETVVTALESALKLWFGSLKEAPLETALITAVSLWKFTKFGQEIGKKIWAAIPEKYTKNIGIKIASIALTWEVGFDIGKWIGEKLFPENATYYENFKWLERPAKNGVSFNIHEHDVGCTSFISLYSHCIFHPSYF